MHTHSCMHALTHTCTQLPKLNSCQQGIILLVWFCKKFKLCVLGDQNIHLTRLVRFGLQNGWLLQRLKETGCCLNWGKAPAELGLPYAQLWTHRLGEAGCQPAGAGWYQQHEWAGSRQSVHFNNLCSSTFTLFECAQKVVTLPVEQK